MVSLLYVTSRCCFFFFSPPIRITAQLKSFEVTGVSRNGIAPTLLSPRRAVEEDKPLLSLMFETNPLDAKADQRLHVESQPLEIIYDAVSVAEDN